MKRLVAVLERTGRCVVHRCALTDAGWWQGIPPAVVLKGGSAADEAADRELGDALAKMIASAPDDVVGEDAVSGPEFRAEEWLYPALGVRTERIFRRGLRSCGVEIDESEIGLFAYNRAGEVVWRSNMSRPDEPSALVRAIRDALEHSG